LEIFDSYRQGIDPNDHQWREKYLWFNLTHVCRKWRAVMLASSSRLDLGITVGPKKPGGIKTVLSSHLPIIFDFKLMYGELTGSVLWRMRAVLRHHHDRVRDITFEGTANDFDEFFKVTKCAFPVLESLSLQFKYCGNVVPDEFLGGPDLSELHLRRLTLCDFSFASISRLLSSGTFLTDLYLSTSMDTAVSSSAVMSLLACLQGMPCLRSLRLFILPDIPDSRSRPSTLEDIVPLSKLKKFRYDGPSPLLNALVAGLSAPSLRDVCFSFRDDLCPPIVHLPRFIDEIEEHYHAVEVDFLQWDFRLLLLTQSEYIWRRKPCFEQGFELYIDLRYHRVSIMRMSGALSTRLTTIEELKLTIASVVWVDGILWRRFYQQFPSVKALRTEGANNAYWIARTLHQGHGEPGDLSFLPALEEIDLGRGSLTDESEWESQLACFEPFVSARQQAGRPVRVFFSP
jgi:hypothetical protein